MTKIVISGTGLYAPPETISNEDLVESYNTHVSRFNESHAAEIAAGAVAALEPSSVEFIVKASGIKSRHVVDKKGVLDPEIMAPRIPERPDDELSVLADMGLHAARDALQCACKTPADVDAVLVACSNMQRPYPAMAIEIQNAMGIEGFGFDMNVACSSATFGIQAAADMVRAGHARSVLVVSPEICSGHLNFRNRDCHFIFGDVATAVLVERAETATSPVVYEIVGTKLKTSFSNNIRNNFGFLNRAAPEGIGKPDKLFVQEGRKVFKEVIPMVADVILDHMRECAIRPEDIKRLWLHQANLHMNDLISRKVLGRDVNPGEAPVILDEFANTSSAGSIIAFNKYNDDLKSGDTGIICSFGAGYSIGSVIVKRV